MKIKQAKKIKIIVSENMQTEKRRKMAIQVGMVTNGVGNVDAFTVHLLGEIFAETDLLEKRFKSM